MRKKDLGVRKKAIKLWLNGGDFRTIRDKTGESVGKLSKDLSELREEFPELNELRKINIFLNEKNLAPEQALKGAQLVKELEKVSIDVDGASDAISQILLYGKEASKTLSQAREFHILVEQSGLSYSQLLEDHKTKTEKAADLTTNIQKLKSESESLKNSIKELHELKKLQDKIQLHNITLEMLDMIVESQLRLEKLGFTSQTAEVLAKELKKNGLDSTSACEKLSYLLSKHKNLEEAVQAIQGTKQTLESIIAKDEETLSKLDKANQDYIGLIDKLERTYEEKRVKLQDEHENLIKNLRSGLEDEKKKFQNTADELKGIVLALEKQREEILGEIKFAQATIDVLSSRDISEGQLESLTKRLGLALEQRRKGYMFVSKAEVEGAKQQLIRGLADFVKMDIISKKENEQVKEQMKSLTVEYTKIKAEADKSPKLNKDIQLRDEAVNVLSRSLFPAKQKMRGVWIMGCPRCGVTSIFHPEPEHSESLPRKGYMTFECDPCGQKTNFTLEDLYYDILKYDYFTLKA